jgi:hypothetical protein
MNLQVLTSLTLKQKNQKLHKMKIANYLSSTLEVLAKDIINTYSRNLEITLDSLSFLKNLLKIK